MRPLGRLAFLAVLPALLFPVSSGATAHPSDPGSIRVQLQFVDEGVFPPGYPRFLKEVYALFRRAERSQQLDLEDIRAPSGARNRRLLTGKNPSTRNLIGIARTRLEDSDFEAFLERFGLNPDNHEDIELEVTAQIARIQHREAYYSFVKKFEEASPLERVELVKESVDFRELEYALRQCKEEQFQILIQQVLDKDGFGPHSPQDKALLDYLLQEVRLALTGGRKEDANQWRAVIAQLVSQPVGQENHRLLFSKTELFAMLRNAERTLEQRRRPFIDISGPIELTEQTASLARQMIDSVGARDETNAEEGLLTYAFLDEHLPENLEQLKQVYTDILANHESGQTEATRGSVRGKKRLLEVLNNSPSKRIDLEKPGIRRMSVQLVRKILESQGQPHHFPFIRGIVLFQIGEESLGCRLIEDFPMIVAGDTYPYQWKHDNEVNIALLLANIDPYQAAQAVRFIIYNGMWRSGEATRLGLYGWLPQIVFGDRQTGKLPQFNNKTYYYFPDFPFRPTKKIDEENERNRTSEIMQLPFFGWTVWRVYEELSKVQPDHALSFLKEVYPYVRANTEAIRTALDPYSEGVLSGRDAWVNGMDNAWYHLMVMRRHLPERLIPNWARDTVEENRVDNRRGKCPGCPEDPELVIGRPSDYYYQFKVVFYDIGKDLGLDPMAVYHSSPYNAKDVAITGVMARSLQAQIDMARVLRKTDADAWAMSALRGRTSETVNSWDEELSRYETYLDLMKKTVNNHFWSSKDKTYYNRDVTQMFRGAADLFFCRPVVHQHNDLGCEPRLEYWTCEVDVEGDRNCVLNQKARASVDLNQAAADIHLDSTGHVQYQYNAPPRYWNWVDNGKGGGEFRLDETVEDPFLVEQFSRLRKDQSGTLYYEPNLDYWTCGKDEKGNRDCQLNQRAKRLIGRGARRIEDGDVVRSPGIAGFFPLFGHIPSDDQAFQLALQVVNPWMWWPVDGIPIPTQPMNKLGPEGEYVPNQVYHPNKYWLGPTWMASNKPVIDGFKSYGYEMLYLYLVQQTAGTLQDGRAVEHWEPETGAVNTTNINFPWTASCIAGSIWDELTEEERGEYLRRFHPRRYAEGRGAGPVAK